MAPETRFSSSHTMPFDLSGVTIHILGASGFIGKNLVQHFSNQGYVVNGLSSCECNLLRYDDVLRFSQLVETNDIIIFCSAILRGCCSPLEIFEQNISMVNNFVKVFQTQQYKKLIFFSTTDIYGRPPCSLPINEAFLPKPNDCYAISKYASEKLLECNSNRSFLVFRLPGIYGLGDKGRSIISSFIRKAILGQKIVLENEGKTLRDYVFIDDVLRYTEQAIVNDISGMFNIASGKSYSLIEMLKVIERETKVKLDIEILEKNIDSSFDLVFDIKKLKKVLPSLDFISLDVGVKQLCQEILKNESV